MASLVDCRQPPDSHRGLAMEVLVTLADPLLANAELHLQTDEAFWQLMRNGMVRSRLKLHNNSWQQVSLLSSGVHPACCIYKAINLVSCGSCGV